MAGRGIRGQARAAVGAGVHELAVLDDGDGGGGHAGLFEHLRGDAVDFGSEGGIDRVDCLSGGLGGRGCGGEDEREDCGGYGSVLCFHGGHCNECDEVAWAMAAGRLTVYGRYYDILTGRIEKYDEGRKRFVALAYRGCRGWDVRVLDNRPQSE